MKISEFISKVLPYSILLITISSVNAWNDIHFGNTFVWWVLYTFVLYLFFKGKKVFGRQLTEKAWPISLFLNIVLLSFIYGCFISEYYWDWKLLVENLMVFMMPLSIYAFSSPMVLRRTFRVWFRYALFAFPIFLLFIHSEAYGRYLVPISVILLFFPILPFKWKIIGIGTLMFIIITSADARSNVMKIVIPLLVSLLYYLRVLWNSRFRKKIYYAITLVLLLSPFVFFSLAVSNTFNIFNMPDYMSKWSSSAEIEKDGESISLLDDTRTLIYLEEIGSAIKNDYWIWGRSMARGYDTKLFIGMYKDSQRDTNRMERPNSEVSILNVFNYFGLIGVLSYFLIFAVASYKAVFMSNNIYMNQIGVYVAFRWLYAWVEDFNLFDLNYLFLWIMIGMCFSKPFKEMNDPQFKNWVKSIFKNSKKYVNTSDSHFAHKPIPENQILQLNASKFMREI